MHGHKFIEHTADIAVEVYAESIEELFEVSALAFKESISEIENYTNSIRRNISIEATTLEELLVNFLNELNFLVQTKKWLFTEMKSIIINFEDVDFKLESNIIGINISENSVTLKEEIKAVTYHQLEIIKVGDQYRTTIIFDI